MTWLNNIDARSFLTVLIVCALSAAETCCDTFCCFYDAVKAVLLAALFLFVIIWRSNLSQSLLLIGKQISPFDAIKLIISGVLLQQHPNLLRLSRLIIKNDHHFFISDVINNFCNTTFFIFYKCFFYIALIL